MLCDELWRVLGPTETTLTATGTEQALGTPHTKVGALGLTGRPYHYGSADYHVCLAPGRPSEYLLNGLMKEC